MTLRPSAWVLAMVWSLTGTAPAAPPPAPAGYKWVSNATLFYVRNISFQLAGSTQSSPAMHISETTNALMLDWIAPGFKLQSQTLTNSVGIGANWVDYPQPAGINPPVTIPLAPVGAGRLFRLAPQ